jgi:cytochrome d ubiquinol oxidase subunit I
VDVIELARWQFAFTTLFHFIFVPLTIGLSAFVATMQTKWVRTGDEQYLRMTQFWGKLLLVNFAIGIATGLVQEFQFGMAWSAYSRYVGDVFGAPLAIEGLGAFFLESTFLGIWIFGWNRLPKKLHLASTWLVFLGTNLSAYFILAANAWMQSPVGYEIDPTTGNAVLTSIWALLTNPVAIYAYLHTIPAALTSAAALIVGISIWHLGRKVGDETDFFRRSVRWGLRGMLVFALATITVGHFFGQTIAEKQPMKMAAAEALYESRNGAPLSLMAIAPFEKKPERLSFSVEIPKLYSFMETNDFDGHVHGINDLQKEYKERYAQYELDRGRDPNAAEYYPIVGLTYWSFRTMVGAGVLMALFAAVGLLIERRVPGGVAAMARRGWFRGLGFGALIGGFLAQAAGWIFTEIGRQPWAVTGLLKTEDAISQLGASTVAISLSVFIVLYLLIGGIEFWLFRKLAISGPTPPSDPPPGRDGDDGDDPSVAPPVPSLAY